MIVVAGVTGHVGSVAADILLSKGQKIRVIVRNADKGASWSKKGAEVAVGALEDQGFLTGALRGATAFFTLLPPNYQATDFFATQRTTADAIAGAVKASGVPYVVVLSSVGADLASGNGPIKGLHYVENALRATGAKMTAVRAASFQENVANVLGAAKGAGVYPSFVPSADYPVPMVATKDIGALVVKSLLSPPDKSEVVDLTGPAYSSRQVAEKLGAALGKPLKVVDIPQAGYVGALVQGGMPQPLAEIMAEMYVGFGTGAIQPKGDRLEHGKTTLDEVIQTLV
jgi:uncharacterized protein YbjT (DUF2867 family)